MAALRRAPRARAAALVVTATLLLACGASGGTPEPGIASETGGSAGAPLTTTGGARATGGAPPLGGATPTGSGGIGLYSSVFEPAAGAGGGGEVVIECDYSAPGCDFSRMEGCCEPLACTHANGANVWDTYPIESCQALIACMRENPGCSTAEDPLCLMDEDPSGPCLDETYAASHTDPEGPYAWTVELMRCVCGYD